MTKSQARKNKRLRIAIAAFDKGQKRKDVARRFGVTPNMVHTAVHEFRGKALAKRKRELRNRLLKLIKRVRNGELLVDVAKDANVAKHQLVAICREKKVKPHGHLGMRKKWQMPKRYARVDWSRRDSQICKDLKVSIVAVYKMRQQLLRRNLIPHRPGIDIYPPRHTHKNKKR